MAKKIAVALGGGGVRGYAHIGVLEQMIQEGYEIAAVSGTSAGGIVGSLFASGYTPEEIKGFIDEINPNSMFGRKSNDPPSILGLSGLYKMMKSKFGEKTFSDLKIPFACTAVDLHSGSEIIINSGKLIDAIEATTAIPGVFPSKIIGRLNMVDGGIFDPVPVASARWLTPNLPIIAVCLTPEQKNWKNLPHLKVPFHVPIPAQVMETVFQLRIGKAAMIFADSIDIMTNMIAELKLKIDKPDYILRPDMRKYAIFDNIDPFDLIMRGKEIVIKKRFELKRIFSTSYRVGRWLKPSHLPGKLFSDIMDEYKLSILEESEQSDQNPKS